MWAIRRLVWTAQAVWWYGRIACDYLRNPVVSVDWAKEEERVRLAVHYMLYGPECGEDCLCRMETEEVTP